MTTEMREEDSPPEPSSRPVCSRQRRAESAKAWQQLQYMGGMQDYDARGERQQQYGGAGSEADTARRPEPPLEEDR